MRKQPVQSSARVSQTKKQQGQSSHEATISFNLDTAATPFDLEATMYGSELLEDEIDWHVIQHREQLASAAKTIEEISTRRIQAQAMAAAEAAGAEMTKRLNHRAEQLQLREQCLEHQHRKALHQIEDFKKQQAALLAYERGEMQRILDDERESLEQERQDMLHDLKLQQQRSEAELKREWDRVTLTNEVGKVFLKQTAEAARAKQTAIDAKIAADLQIKSAMETEQKFVAETQAQTNQRKRGDEQREVDLVRLAHLESEVVELRAEIARLREVADEAERRTRLAERVLDTQSIFAQSMRLSTAETDKDQFHGQVDQQVTRTQNSLEHGNNASVNEPTSEFDDIAGASHEESSKPGHGQPELQVTASAEVAEVEAGAKTDSTIGHGVPVIQSTDTSTSDGQATETNTPSLQPTTTASNTTGIDQPSAASMHEAAGQAPQNEDPFATLRAIEAAFAGPPSAAMQTDYSSLLAEGIPPDPQSMNSEHVAEGAL